MKLQHTFTMNNSEIEEKVGFFHGDNYYYSHKSSKLNRGIPLTKFMNLWKYNFIGSGKPLTHKYLQGLIGETA